MRKLRHLDRRLEAASGWRAGDPAALRGRWTETLMPGARALCLELGCGKGTFLCESARRRPDCLFVGLERIPDAAVRGMERAACEALVNARFVLADAAELEELFAPGEARELYINFPDPWPHWKRAPRRLTHRGFLAAYARILAPGGTLRFKTDNVPLFRFSVAELQAAGWRILRQTEDHPAGEDNVETEYESRFRAQGVKICMLEAERPGGQDA